MVVWGAPPGGWAHVTALRWEENDESGAFESVWCSIHRVMVGKIAQETIYTEDFGLPKQGFLAADMEA